MADREWTKTFRHRSRFYLYISYSFSIKKNQNKTKQKQKYESIHTPFLLLLFLSKKTELQVNFIFQK